MAKPIKHGSNWRIRWMDANGKRRSEVHSSFDDAKFALKKKEFEAEDIRRGHRGCEPPGKTLGEMFDYWLKNRTPLKRRPKDDVCIIRRHLRPAFGHLKLSDFGIHHVDQFVADRRHLSDKTLHNHLTHLTANLNLAHDLGWLARVPRIRKPKIIAATEDYSFLRSDEEISRFLNAARKHGERVFNLYATAIFTGLRQGELAGLKWDDVDLEAELINVRRSFDGPTKNKKTRYVPIAPELVLLLKQWRLKRFGEYVFYNSFGNRLKPCNRIFQEVLHDVLLEAGFPKKNVRGKMRSYIVFHDLRHTFASWCVRKEFPLFKVQHFLGHHSVQMTNRYAHLIPGDLKEGMDRLRVPKFSAPKCIPLAARNGQQQETVISG